MIAQPKFIQRKTSAFSHSQIPVAASERFNWANLSGVQAADEFQSWRTVGATLLVYRARIATIGHVAHYAELYLSLANDATKARYGSESLAIVPYTSVFQPVVDGQVYASGTAGVEIGSEATSGDDPEPIYSLVIPAGGLQPGVLMQQYDIGSPGTWIMMTGEIDWAVVRS